MRENAAIVVPDDLHDAVGAFDDEVDLVFASLSAQMMHPRLAGLCVHPHREGHQRLEQRSEECSVALPPSSP